MRRMRDLAISVLFLSVSRVIGIGRELLIAAVFGLSKITDLFFQATFIPTSLLAIMLGPFTTAFIARFASSSPGLRGAHLRYYRRKALLVGFGAMVVFLLAGAVFGPLNGRIRAQDAITAFVILAPAVPAMVVLGFANAANIACGRIGRASGILLANNIVFVASIAMAGLAASRSAIWPLPAAYSIAACVAGVIGWRAIDQLEAQGAERPCPLPALGRSFLLAGSESSVFLLTQTIVLALASRAGEGWASAASLAQRISLSVLGLVISPVASSLMLTISRRPDRAGGILIRSAAITTLCLTAAAVALVLGRHIAVDALVRMARVNAKSAALLSEALPPFATWMIAMGVNALVGRLMFAANVARIYIPVIVGAYLVADVARVALGLTGSFGLCIFAGAAIELAGGLAAAAYGYWRLRGRNWDGRAA